MRETARSTAQPALQRIRLHPVTLRFSDPALEAAFQADYFRHAIVNLRVALAGGAVLLAVWGIVLHGQILAVQDRQFDVITRYGVFIPLVLITFGLTFIRGFERVWEWVTVALATVLLLLFLYSASQILTMPTEYGYVGLILITAFNYTLVRLRFVLIVFLTLVAVGIYIPYAVSAVYISGVTTLLAILFLTSFGALGCLAAYRIERNQRVLFLRERQLDLERERSDNLLLNILPQAIVDRLKARSGDGRVADALDEVSVVFADAVNSTGEAAKSSPEEFADALDELFSKFDRIADRNGLEKIKTIGDAYMAVAGAPVPMEDNAAAAANMALEMIEEAGKCNWPSGVPVQVRVGVATGPAVAGVIGQRKFAYDIWGDTVNLASRLEANGEPGRVLVSWKTAERLEGRYEFGEPEVIDIKGRGTTPVRFLHSPRSRMAARTIAP
ncbi:MAG TPA: adenylate/guanylate cyclase domain-containing protein [Actinomycetota bacterium]|nr:adenylate/guanylate cyclase domain-containing protein [Actinomycetota bacterium]